MADEDTPEENEVDDEGTGDEDMDFYIEYLKSPFWKGFNWAMQLSSAVTGEHFETRLHKIIKEVAAGETSLEPTPEEAATKFRASWLNPSNKAVENVKKAFSGESRRELDSENRKLAAEYVRMMTIINNGKF